MKLDLIAKRLVVFPAVWAAMAGIGSFQPVFAQDASPQAQAAPPIVEWVYRVRWGYYDEWYAIFKKYQIAVLDEEKKEGLVTKYIVQRGSGHSLGEASRWDLRVLIYYKDRDSQARGRGIAQKLFPDQETFRKEEQQRWQLTAEHWDRPLTELDPHGEKASN
ncbi:MAG: hypothetical protein ABSH56_15910 [Bryobacteraceae bacterium]|jgi:hypothetical protein